MVANGSIPRVFTWCIIVSAVLGASIAGCSGTSGSGKHVSGDPAVRGTSDPATKAGDPPSLSASAQQGKELFDRVGCMGCHMVNGRGGMVGPDLSNEANRGRSKQWLATQIRDPRENDPQTIMPAFNNLTNRQVNDLVEYLSSLGTTDAQSGSDAAAVDTSAKSAKTGSVAPGTGVTAGGKLWGTTCGQCHNLRSPSEYTDTQWAVAVHHMRVRVPLTGEQQKKILEFLQASN